MDKMMMIMVKSMIKLVMKIINFDEKLTMEFNLSSSNLCVFLIFNSCNEKQFFYLQKQPSFPSFTNGNITGLT